MYMSSNVGCLLCSNFPPNYFHILEPRKLYVHGLVQTLDSSASMILGT